jgi:hypothetical protein
MTNFHHCILIKFNSEAIPLSPWVESRRQALLTNQLILPLPTIMILIYQVVVLLLQKAKAA